MTRRACVFVLLLSSGCAGPLVSTQTPFMESVGDIEMSSRELRVRVVEFGRHFSATIEKAADDISASTSDPTERRYATLWKARAIPAAQEAVLQIDPLMALVDIWAFALQMEDFFESGSGAGWFSSGGLATSKQLVADVRRLATKVSVSGDIRGPEAEIEIWVNNHPIVDDQFLRDSVIGSGADLLGNQRGAFALVEDMSTTTREIGYRLAFYNEYLLKQVRWAAELGGDAFFRMPAVDSLLTALHETMATASTLSRELDVLAEREREALTETIGVERSLLLADVERQRVALLEALSTERAIVLEALSNERVLAMQSVAGELETALETMTSMFEETKTESRAVVDYAMYRIAQLVAVVLGVMFLFAAVLILVFRRMMLPRDGR